MTLVQCYNKGCGKKYDPAENGSEACVYHPGPPFFHDAYKQWQCCGKKSTDFGTWLAYPGCARGPHNPEKPEDIVRVSAVKEIRPEKEDEVIVWNGLNKSTARVENTEPRGPPQVLRNETTAAARAAIERFKETAENDAQSNELRVGALCRNAACDASYSGPESDFPGSCQHHPGTAIFHEGMKFWSCCKKRTTDFGAFLEQVGCEKGNHVWSKNERVDKVREDWFASNGQVHINIYCKNALPERTVVKTDGLSLTATVVHGFGDKETELSYDLWNEILPEDSLASITERKVEIILKQKTTISWPRLRYDPVLDGGATAEAADGESSDSEITA